MDEYEKKDNNDKPNIMEIAGYFHENFRNEIVPIPLLPESIESVETLFFPPYELGNKYRVYGFNYLFNLFKMNIGKESLNDFENNIRGSEKMGFYRDLYGWGKLILFPGRDLKQGISISTAITEEDNKIIMLFKKANYLPLLGDTYKGFDRNKF